MARSDLTAQRLRELLSYDPEDGAFTWRQDVGKKIRAGMVAGSDPCNGVYRRIGIDGNVHLAHRLAWLYVHGKWPVGQIDHKFGNRAETIISELRDASHAENQQNRRVPGKANTSGFLGVSKTRGGRWMAGITINGRRRYLGTCYTREQAYELYVEIKRKVHPGCTL